MDNCPYRYLDEKFKKRTFTNTKGKREEIFHTVHSGIYNLTDQTAIWVGNEHYGKQSYAYHLAPVNRGKDRTSMQSSLCASANNSSMRELSVTDLDKTTNQLQNGLLTIKSWKVNSFRLFI